MKAIVLTSLFIAASTALTGSSVGHPIDPEVAVPLEAVTDADLEREPAPAFHAVDLTGPEHSFYFTRAIYGGARGIRGSPWATDYPQADDWIINVLNRLTGIDVAPYHNTVRLDDPELRRFPFLYALEVGGMRLSQAEVRGLREYLLAGGFLVIDDFWGSWEWANFEFEIGQVLPEYEIVDLPLDHPIFSTYYGIEEIVQVPNVGNGRSVGYGSPGATTTECGGCYPLARGIFDEHGRLMVVINWNTDLGDAWEWAEDPLYPLQFSTYAYQMAANFVVYAMTH